MAAPILFNLTMQPWRVNARRLLRLFDEEVLGQKPVVQHMLFGELVESGLGFEHGPVRGVGAAGADEGGDGRRESEAGDRLVSCGFLFDRHAPAAYGFRPSCRPRPAARRSPGAAAPDVLGCFWGLNRIEVVNDKLREPVLHVDSDRAPTQHRG